MQTLEIVELVQSVGSRDFNRETNVPVMDQRVRLKPKAKRKMFIPIGTMERLRQKQDGFGVKE